MPFVYILYSQKINRYYIGSTSGSLEERIEKHFLKTYGKKAFTSKADDWTLFWSLYCESVEHARKLESKLKKMKSKVYLDNLIKYPELVNKIIKQTKLI